jgi:DNA-binding NtrC family response regulator
VAAREGAFEAAEGGTIFLDEIGELAPELQPKLLRALERREVKRVGSNRYTKVDARIVAATNRNLRADVNAGKFRSDLFYRLAVVQVALPPLRERIEDIPLLVEHMIEGMSAGERPGAAVLRSPEILGAMRNHAWPGNVRELRNYVERCIALNTPGPLAAPGEESAERGTAVALAPSIDLSRPLREGREQWVNAFERAYLGAALRAHGGNVTSAARASKIDRIQFYRLLWRHGLK